MNFQNWPWFEDFINVTFKKENKESCIRIMMSKIQNKTLKLTSLAFYLFNF